MTQAHLKLFTITLCASSLSYAEDMENVPVDDMRAQQQAIENSIMIDVASPAELEKFSAKLQRPILTFGEDRSNGIRPFIGTPKHWLADGHKQLDSFSGVAQPGEFYVFQVGVVAVGDEIGPLQASFEDLSSGDSKITANKFRCISLGGTNLDGEKFTKDITVAKGGLQALWFGIDLPKDQTIGSYTGQLVISGGKYKFPVQLNIDVKGDVLEDHGDSDSRRLSRLRWLDSTLAHDDDDVFAPYTPLVRKDKRIDLLGKSLTLGENGLPAGFDSYFTEGNIKIGKQATSFLSSPFHFVIATKDGEIKLQPESLDFTKDKQGRIEWTASSAGDGIKLRTEAFMEFDGFIRCKNYITATRDLQIEDIRLETSTDASKPTFMNGLTFEGKRVNEDINWKWDPRYNQDSFWIGHVNAGFRLQLKDQNFRASLPNIYFKLQKLVMPESWSNDGKGGITMQRKGDKINITAYSGPRSMQAGKELLYQFDMNLTPFHTVDTDKHFSTRYYHTGPGIRSNDWTIEQMKEAGVNVRNIHHNKLENPTINYPYFDASLPHLKEYVKKAHAAGIKVKLYYTTREITNNMPELFAFHSMNGEIILPGPVAAKDVRTGTNRNGPHEWLLGTIGDGFIPAWRETLRGPYNGLLDLSVITTPDSRLDNFYIEGLNYLIKEANIDGIYIDGTTLDRKTLQRVRRLLLANNPDSRIDMHLWRGSYSIPSGYNSAMLNSLYRMPYYDRVWPGEGYRYHADADNYLIEISGTHLGLAGEMLRGGGNPGRGMVFGMTNRLGWHGEPRDVWKVWDEFGIIGSEMFGWWRADCPVKSSNDKIYATAYLKDGAALIALGNWSEEDESTTLDIDWKALGLDPKQVTIEAPEIGEYAKQNHHFEKKKEVNRKECNTPFYLQDAASYQPNDAINIPYGRGKLLIIKQK